MNSINCIPLKADYDQKFSQLRSSIRGIKVNLLFAFSVNVLIIIAVTIMGYFDTGFDNVDVLPLLCAYLGLLIIPIIGLFLLKLSQSELHANIEKIKSMCICLNKNDNQKIYSASEDVMDKMGIVNRNLQILYVQSNKYFPGILEQKGEIFLIIPRNFLILFFSKPHYARALLVHEFGHVLQKDSNNYLLTGILAKKAFVFGLIMIVFSILSFLFTGHIGISLITIYGITSFTGLSKRRLYSETLADTSVLLFDDGNNLINALQEYGIHDPIQNLTHPSPQKRIDLLKEKIQKYKLYELELGQ